MRWLLVKAGKRSPAHRLSAPRKHIRLVELITCSLRLSSPNTILGHTCLLAQILPHNCHRGAGTYTIHVLHQQGVRVYAVFAGACRTGWTPPNKRLSCGPTASALWRDVGILGAGTQRRGGKRVKTEMREVWPISSGVSNVVYLTSDFVFFFFFSRWWIPKNTGGKTKC